MSRSKINNNQVNFTPTLTTATLDTGWANFDSGAIPATGVYRFPRYFKDTTGMVHLSGLVTNNSGSANTAFARASITTLPAGCRPGHNLRVITVAKVGSTDVAMEIEINANGSVKLCDTNSIANGDWVSLNNIHFIAEQ